MVVPMRFGDVEVLVQAVPVTAVGSEDVGVGNRIRATYDKVEPVIVGVASSVAVTVSRLKDQASAPRQVEVTFGVGISMGGDAVLVKGEATLEVTLTYELA
jgi:hypothetical protein